MAKYRKMLLGTMASVVALGLLANPQPVEASSKLNINAIYAADRYVHGTVAKPGRLTIRRGNETILSKKVKQGNFKYVIKTGKQLKPGQKLTIKVKAGRKVQQKKLTVKRAHLKQATSYQKAKTVYGTTVAFGNLEVRSEKGKVLARGRANRYGEYTVKLKKQYRVGTKLRVKVSRGAYTKTKLIKIKKTPKIKKLKVNSIQGNKDGIAKVSGTSSVKNGKITIKRNGKVLKTTKTSVKGKYSVKVTKLKDKQKLNIQVKNIKTGATKQVNKKVVMYPINHGVKANYASANTVQALIATLKAQNKNTWNYSYTLLKKDAHMNQAFLQDLQKIQKIDLISNDQVYHQSVYLGENDKLTNIQDLKFVPNLKFLNLVNQTKLTNLTNVAFPKTMTTIGLKNTGITSLATATLPDTITNLTLEDNKKLTTLNGTKLPQTIWQNLTINNSPITTMNNVRWPKKVTNVSVMNSQIDNANVKVLAANLKPTRSLNLNRNNRITSIAGVQFQGTFLYFTMAGAGQQGKLTDITGLKLPSTVRDVSFFNNQIRQLPSDDAWPNVKILELTRNKLTSLQPLVGLKQLEKLFVNENNLANLNGLPTTNLKTLEAKNNKLTGLASGVLPDTLFDLNLSNDTKATLGLNSTTTLNNNRITTLANVQLPAKLKHLYLNRNSLQSIASVQFPASLQTLVAKNNNLDKFPQYLPGDLKRLNLASNQLQNFDGVHQLPAGLISLDLSHNRYANGFLPNATVKMLAVNVLRQLEYLSFSNQLNNQTGKYNSKVVVNSINEFQLIGGIFSERVVYGVTYKGAKDGDENKSLEENEVTTAAKPINKRETLKK
ncbi:hypothetical protein EQG49_03335 [Periweissella cryptocerci]|uniref:Leucine-rich repeat domain-containing protein n=1 Tax=Periweissella cryptocerci TaxID=2506420 RepID=A0A4P6YS97_9LACO|nr:Ig-like domain-containing protein [Periweissella cryptocerci]QBO35558.1 hypothetical protein EQG49_03335 [Periweissella cryptocerci]